jgi:membrane protease YdiL (CAAX protease family)
MRHLFTIVILFILILLCGALLSFPVYKLLQPVTDIAFHKLISYTSTLCGLVLLGLWFRYENRLSPETVGFIKSGPAVIISQMLTGFFAGIIIIVILASALLVLGIYQIEPDLTFNPAAGGRIIMSALFAGVMVGIIEETLYRGVLFGGLLTRMRAPGTILLSSIIYSGVHFLKFRGVPADFPITWFSGVQLLPGAFYQFRDPAIIDAFLSLFAFGVLLAMVRLKSGALYQCMGLHAGVVATLKIVNKTTDYVPHNNLAFLVNKYDHQLGYLALFWLVVCILVYYRSAFAGTRTNRLLTISD